MEGWFMILPYCKKVKGLIPSVCVCFLSQSKPLQCEQCVCVNECVNAGEPHFESLCVVCRVDLGPVFLQLYLNQHKHLFYIVLKFAKAGAAGVCSHSG